MPEYPKGTYLAFDFGLKKYGVAVGDSETKVADALAQIPAQKGHPNWHEILKIIETWRPVALVVGLPLNIDGSQQHITIKAKGFSKVLKEKTNLPVFLADERCTTVEARAQLFDQGGYRALQGQVDAHAARIILEMFWAH